jgi:hypothetical protein
MVRLTLIKREPPEFAARMENAVFVRTVVAGDTVALRIPVLVEKETFAEVRVALTLDGIV